jgi:signal transduction histidine kinase
VRLGARPTDDDGEHVEFFVSDNGVGIAREHLPRIFEKFFRVPGQPGDSGTGLGLALAKDIIEAHGGRIVVESVEGHGTTFRFTLPRAADVNAREEQPIHQEFKDVSRSDRG